jgi:hypothetical protein
MYCMPMNGLTESDFAGSISLCNSAVPETQPEPLADPA